MKARALITRSNGRKQTVYLQHEAGRFGQGWWATASETNSDRGYTLSDHAVMQERYSNGERVESERLVGATWAKLPPREEYTEAEKASLLRSIETDN